MSALTGEVDGEKLQPMRMLGNTVLLKPLAPELSSASGILFPPSHAEEKMQWVVVAIGPGKRMKDGTWLLPEVRWGDKVLYNMNRLGNRYAFEDGRIIVDADQVEMQWV